MKLNYKRTFFVGLAFLSICSFWQMYDSLVPLMLKNTFHLSDTKTGFVMGIDNILALFMLPLFGALSDKINTPIGKRTPFIIGGTLLAVISMIFLPVADRAKNLTLFSILLGIVLIAMSSYRSPTVALMPDLTPKPLRSKANAIINLMGAVGSVYTLLIIMLLVKKDTHNNYMKVFLAVATLMIVAVLILFFTIKEKKIAVDMKKVMEEVTPETSTATASGAESIATIDKGKDMPREVRKSFFFILASIFLWFFAYNAVTTAYSRYAEVVWNFKAGGFAKPLLIATGAALICYIPIGIIASKIGRKKTIIIGILMMTFSYLCGALLVDYTYKVNIVFAIIGIGWAAISVNSYPMVVEMCKGTDIGKYTGMYYAFSMSAQIVTPTVSGALLEHISYRTLFPYAIIFSLASLCTMLFVKHGDSRPLKKVTLLENFDTED